jgi:DNA polymerase-3 subunit alpha (Gram-positive type)
MIRKLQDLSGIDPQTIPADDKGVMALFSGTEILGVTPEQIGTPTGMLGIPEFGTNFVRGMVEETHPTTFSELLQLSGLSHGTDVWLGNAQDLIKSGIADLSTVIGCRDDIILLQNAFLFAKRKSATLEEKIEPLSHLYLGLNILCLVYWLLIQFM